MTSQSFETYVVNVSRSVDHIIALDRLRQELAWRALLLGNHNVSRVRKDDVISMISRSRGRNPNRASSVYSHQVHGNNHHDNHSLHPHNNHLNLSGISQKSNSYLNVSDQNT